MKYFPICNVTLALTLLLTLTAETSFAMGKKAQKPENCSPAPEDAICGTTGSIKDRLASCCTTRSSDNSGKQWALVSRFASKPSIPDQSNPYEIWLDESSGKIWANSGQNLSGRDANLLCFNKEIVGVTGDLLKLNWTVPSEDEWDSGKNDGLMGVIGHGGYWTNYCYSDDRTGQSKHKFDCSNPPKDSEDSSSPRFLHRDAVNMDDDEVGCNFGPGTCRFLYEDYIPYRSTIAVACVAAF